MLSDLQRSISLEHLRVRITPLLTEEKEPKKESVKGLNPPRTSKTDKANKASNKKSTPQNEEVKQPLPTPIYFRKLLQDSFSITSWHICL